ncbi:uncharacterized protein LOC130974738 [Arachis stenosperma]|uniref:uncharacterized protein LOC130974738 n=1 Tax=Arachis stenosperma TaxID=217475 RepID=UPI0025AC61D3|nr:uncharacterized protein LOC130974738 [Arachis stenosperma]
MRRVMLELVGKTQSASVQGRKIHDRTLIACETVRWLKKMGFGQRWRGWIKECVCTASMMVGEIVRHGRIAPMLVGKNNIELSHLQFANDTILFFPQEEETVKNYKRLLWCFELMSKLNINFDKSSLIPVNCKQEWFQRMCKVLGCKEASLPVKYLGISLRANLILVKIWKLIIGKVEDILNLWKAKVLNKPGKLVPKRGGLWRDIYQLQIKEQKVKDKMVSGLALEVGMEEFDSGRIIGCPVVC